MISTLVRLSRLPVGSSARISSGSLTSARDRDALLLAARQLVRLVVGPLAEAHRAQQLERLLVALPRRAAAAVVEQRQLDVL